MDQAVRADTPNPLAVATGDAVVLIKAHLATDDRPSAEVVKALALIAGQCGYEIISLDEDDDCESLPVLDVNEIDEARARATRGEIEDAVIHLGRALPPEFAVIADRIGDHLRRA